MAPSKAAAAGGELRDGFKFRSGHVALDLAATVAGRFRPEPRELMTTPEDLGRWLVAAGLAAPNPHPSAAELADARELREALYRLALARARGGALAGDDVARVNGWAALSPPAPQLTADGIRWVGEGVPALLAALARAGVELLGGPLAERIRECGSETCTILFLDTSRSGERRWCSMSACGNKAKVAEFRRRQRQAGE